MATVHDRMSGRKCFCIPCKQNEWCRPHDQIVSYTHTHTQRAQRKHSVCVRVTGISDSILNASFLFLGVIYIQFTFYLSWPVYLIRLPVANRN